MSRIELFQFPNLQGRSITLSADTRDLSCVGFWRLAQSLRICGDPWVVFTDKQYEGDFGFYEHGTYNFIPGFAGFIGSLRIVPGGFCAPKITLYEHVNYLGRAIAVERAVNFLCDFNDKASSHKTQSGAWILYEHANYKGNRMVTVAGDEVPNYVSLGWNDTLSSLRPITRTKACE